MKKFLDFWPLIAQAIEKQGFEATAYRLSKFMNVTTSSADRYLKGVSEPSFDKVIALFHTLDIDLSELGASSSDGAKVQDIQKDALEPSMSYPALSVAITPTFTGGLVEVDLDTFRPRVAPGDIINLQPLSRGQIVVSGFAAVVVLKSIRTPMIGRVMIYDNKETGAYESLTIVDGTGQMQILPWSKVRRVFQIESLTSHNI